MRTLQFLLILLVLLALALGLVSYALYDDSALLLSQGLEGSLQQSQSLWNKLQEYFRDAGSWNYLVLALLLAICLILFVITDLLLAHKLQVSKPRDFWSAGLVGLSHRMLTLSCLLAEVIIIANIVVVAFANNRMYYKPEQVPGRCTVLLLGTSKYLQDDGQHINLYYQQRIQAVEALVKAQKVKRIIISGDNGRVDYNEPADMRRSLMEQGIPESLISLDYAGFRTLDSIVRLKGHFGADSEVLIVSQRFHVERGLALAWSYDVEAYGYPAAGKPTPQMMLRELLAKPKALLDVFIFNMQPRYGKTYAKSTIDWKNQRDQQFTALVAGFWLFALMLLFLFYLKK